MSKRRDAPGASDPESPPPIFGTWGRFYGFVVVNTLLVFALLVLFSVATR